MPMCIGSWAYDNFEQAINRVHRLNSLWDVNVYPIICEGSIDRKLEAMIQEKGDAAELVLDGHLLGEHQSEFNLAELLHIAQKEFSASHTGQTIDESRLEEDWPKLRLLLGRAMQLWHAGIGCTPGLCSTSTNTCPMEITMQAKQVDETLAVRKDSATDNAICAELPLWKQEFRLTRN
jgi:SNF2 family DNA or RNA helicase